MVQLVDTAGLPLDIGAGGGIGGRTPSGLALSQDMLGIRRMGAIGSDMKGFASSPSAKRGLNWVTGGAGFSSTYAGAMAYGNGVFISIGTAGTTSNVARSTDGGRNWSIIPLPSTKGCSTICTNGQGHWLITQGIRGITAGSANHFASFDNGATWLELTSPSSEQYSASCWCGGRFYMIGFGTGNTTLWSSSDLVKWESQGTTPLGISTYPSSFSSDGVRVIAFDAQGLCCVSQDGGRTWEQRSTPTGGLPNSIKLFNGLLFMASNTSPVAHFYSTNCGRTWTSVPISNNSDGWSRHVAYGNGLYVLPSTGGFGRYAVSQNGTDEWLYKDNAPGGLANLVFGGGVFVGFAPGNAVVSCGTPA
jgi:hypothetical protein